MSYISADQPLIEPVDFGDDFNLYDERLDSFPLEKVNSFSNDQYLIFDQREHKYHYTGIPMEYSVTSLVERYFEKFNTLEVIEKMMKGKNWPRPEYTVSVSYGLIN
jgi:hypothetical protein